MKLSHLGTHHPILSKGRLYISSDDPSLSKLQLQVEDTLIPYAGGLVLRVCVKGPMSEGDIDEDSFKSLADVLAKGKVKLRILPVHSVLIDCCRLDFAQKLMLVTGEEFEHIILLHICFMHHYGKFLEQQLCRLDRWLTQSVYDSTLRITLRLAMMIFSVLSATSVILSLRYIRKQSNSLMSYPER